MDYYYSSLGRAFPHQIPELWYLVWAFRRADLRGNKTEHKLGSWSPVPADIGQGLLYNRQDFYATYHVTCLVKCHVTSLHMSVSNTVN